MNIGLSSRILSCLIRLYFTQLVADSEIRVSLENIRRIQCMTFHHVAGSPVFTPNKIPFIINFQSKWSAEALESLKKSCEPEAHKQGEFDKLDNPLLNGLKNLPRMSWCFARSAKPWSGS